MTPLCDLGRQSHSAQCACLLVLSLFSKEGGFPHAMVRGLFPFSLAHGGWCCCVVGDGGVA
jgi:hypothetical protein